MTLLAAGVGIAGESWWDGAYATGDWGGQRTVWSEHGIDLNVSYTADSLWNTRGGQATGFAYMGLLEFGVDLDLESLTGWWHGGSLRLSGINTHQTAGVTIDLVGDLSGISNVEAPERTRWYELWLAQELLDGQLLVQAGNLLADADFATTDFAGHFLNAGFGWSQSIAANTGGLVPAYPLAAPGIRVAWTPGDAWQLQAGVHDGDALDDRAGDADGAAFELAADQGLFAIAEVAWHRNAGPDDEGLPGTYKLGGFFHSREVEDLYHDINGGSWIVTGEPARTYDGNLGFYVAVDQWLLRENGDAAASEQGLGMFFRGAILPADRSLVHFAIDAGLSYAGLLPGRAEDIAALGIVWLGISPEERRRQEDDRDINGAPVPALSDFELAVELTYQWRLNDWWYVQPDFQWLIHPGGSAALPDAFVIGVRTGLTF